VLAEVLAGFGRQIHHDEAVRAWWYTKHHISTRHA
jgi:hypothetical protein